MNYHISKNQIPLDIGTIHFTGIGGIGMSGIAEILHNLGYKVQGSDVADSAIIQRLKSLGIKVFTSQRAENIHDIAVVVRSSAVTDTNEEISAARNQSIPVILRAEMLAELMRLKTSIAVAGTHGKTTTTSLVTSLFAEAKLDPTVINGGILNAYGTNARLGTGQWLIAEADESDGTFLKLPATIGIITNIDPEHMNHYGNFEVLKQAFRDFIEHLPFYGFGVLCKDHPVVNSLIQTIHDRRIISYGIEQTDANILGENIRPVEDGTLFDVRIDLKGNAENTLMFKDIKLSIPGKHNVLNALAAIGIAVELGFSEDVIKKAFSHFQGVKRRFTDVGHYNGVRFIDDYGHHPTEIEHTLKAARDIQMHTKGRVIAIVQPHRYTRLKSLFTEFSQCFDHADTVIVAPVYAAGESPILGIDHLHLADAIRKCHSQNVFTYDSESELPDLIRHHSSPGDIIIFLGAGNITKTANEMPTILATMKS